MGLRTQGEKALPNISVGCSKYQGRGWPNPFPLPAMQRLNASPALNGQASVFSSHMSAHEQFPPVHDHDLASCLCRACMCTRMLTSLQEYEPGYDADDFTNLDNVNCSWNYLGLALESIYDHLGINLG